MDKLQNKLEQIDSEDDIKDIASSLDLTHEEKNISESSESLDDFLMFDAQVLAASSTGTTDIDNINELLEGSDDQQSEERLDASDEDGASSKIKKEGEQETQEFLDVAPGLVIPDIEQQGGYNGAALASIQDDRILQLESELADLKRMSLAALVVAILALIVGLWLGTVDFSAQLELGKQDSVVMDGNGYSVVPEIDENQQKAENLPAKNTELETEIKNSEKTLILPEDDISGLNGADDVVKPKEGVEVPVNEKKLVKVPVKRKNVIKAPAGKWVVNLYSYEQRWEADKKMEELMEKGISTEMIVVKVSGRRWFRVRTTGFRTKAEAESYATKIKKKLNNGLAWVSNI